MEPKQRQTKPTWVASYDFASLYPNIMGGGNYGKSIYLWQKELKRQQLLEERRLKIQKINELINKDYE